MAYDAFCMGNALMDYLVQVDDIFLSRTKLAKGCMTMVTDSTILELFEKVRLGSVITMPGGSAANTSAGIARLGGRALFCGKVGRDEHGTKYTSSMRDEGVVARLAQGDGLTGIAMTFITPDTQRSFATHLGVASELDPSDVPQKDVRQSRYLHVEGYAFLSKRIKEASLAAIDTAKDAKVQVSLDISSCNVIKDNLPFFRKLVKDSVDILFLNEEEAEAFTGKRPHDALEAMAGLTSIAVVKLGENGSIIKHNGTVYPIPSIKAKPVDTTGAGDMYAAGMLYGLSRGKTIERSAAIASLAAGRIVEQIGARFSKPMHTSEEMRRLLYEQ